MHSGNCPDLPWSPLMLGEIRGSPKTWLHRPVLSLLQSQGQICSGDSWGSKLANSAARQPNSDQLGRTGKGHKQVHGFCDVPFLPLPQLCFWEQQGIETDRHPGFWNAQREGRSSSIISYLISREPVARIWGQCSVLACVLHPRLAASAALSTRDV